MAINLLALENVVLVIKDVSHVILNRDVQNVVPIMPVFRIWDNISVLLVLLIVIIVLTVLQQIELFVKTVTISINFSQTADVILVGHKITLKGVKVAIY